MKVKLVIKPLQEAYYNNGEYRQAFEIDYDLSDKDEIK